VLTRHPYILVVLLSFIGGYVDTFGFIALFGLFTAHITGNFVLIGSMLAHPTPGVVLKLMAFPAFILSVVMTRVIIINYEKAQRSPLRVLFSVQVVFLIGFMLVGVMAPHPIDSDKELLPILAGMLGAAAMAIQNAGSRTTLDSLVPTTVMTGNVTNMIIDLVDIFYGKNNGHKAQAVSRLRQLAPAIVAFFIGAISAAGGYIFLAFWGLLLPIVLLLILTAISKA